MSRTGAYVWRASGNDRADVRPLIGCRQSPQHGGAHRIPAAAVEFEPPAGYALCETLPSTAGYLRLREVSGLTPRSSSSADAGLPNSVFAVCIRHADGTVGMGRIIGDGALFLHVVDVAVDPRHQGRGLGKSIVASLLAYIGRTAPAEAYVSLMANGEAYRLYEQFGFSSVMLEARGLAAWLGRPP